MKFNKLKILMLSALIVPTTSVFSEEESSSVSFSGNVGLYSDYIFRGYTQTKGQPALQGGFDLEHASGLYIGTWASNVEWTTQGGYMDSNSIEVDVYAGFAGSAGPVDFDIGVLQFLYPGDNTAGAAEADATELYIGIAKDLGPLSASVYYYNVISTDAWGFADADGSDYWTLDVDVPLGETPITASFHVGHQEFDGTGNEPFDYTDWKVNLDYGLSDTYSAGVYFTDTDMTESDWTVAGEFLGQDSVGVYLSAGF